MVTILGDHHFPVRIVSGVAVNGLPFSVSPDEVLDHVGEPDDVRVNHNGEVEYLFRLDPTQSVIYRCFHHSFVECTFPDRGPIVVDGMAVLAPRPWLDAQPGALNVARFCISQIHSIAYDYRFPDQGSITVFRHGHWDALLSRAREL